MAPDSVKLRIGIVGPGRLGQALGHLLYGLGQPVTAVAGRDVPEKPVGDLSRTSAAARFIGSNVRAVQISEIPTLCSHILITVPDDALPSVAGKLAQGLPETPGSGVVALHTSGARGPEALAPLQDRGVSCGTLHPLQTIATPEQGAADLPGSYFGITAAGEALDWALEICRLLQGHPLMIPAERRPLYHAAAVMASNYIMAMIDAAVILFEQCSVGREDALRALAPMICSSVANTLASGPEQALTGPIERGDAQTVASHLQALCNNSESVPESVRELYRYAGLHVAALARRKNPGTDRRAIEELLRGEEQP